MSPGPVLVAGSVIATLVYLAAALAHRRRRAGSGGPRPLPAPVDPSDLLERLWRAPAYRPPHESRGLRLPAPRYGRSYPTRKRSS